MTLLSIQPPPGIVKNGTELQQANAWNDGNLVRWNEGSLQPVGGWNPRTTVALTGKCRNILAYLDNDADRRTVAGTHSHLFYVGDDGVLQDITPSGFTVGTPDAEQNLAYGGLTWNLGSWNTPRPDTGNYVPATTWSLDTFGQFVIGCSTSDGKLYQWENNPSNIAAALSNAPIDNIASVVTEERFVVALGAGGVGNKVAFSDQENSNLWTPASTNQAGSFTLATNGNLVLGRRMRGETLLLTDLDAHVMRFIGPPFVFSFQQVGTGCGAISANACVIADGSAIWMGLNGFFTYSGSVKSLRCSVGDFIFENMNAAQRSKVFGVLNSRFAEVVWFYPSSGSTENDKYVSYNYRENHWQIGSLNRTAGFDSGPYAYPNYVDDTGIVYQHEAGYGYDTDTEIFVQSGPIEIGNGDRYMVAKSLISDENAAGAVTATFKTKNYPTAAESTHGPFTLTSTPTSVRFTGRQVNMRVTGVQNSSWRVGNMRLDVVPGGRR